MEALVLDWATMNHQSLLAKYRHYECAIVVHVCANHPWSNFIRDAQQNKSSNSKRAGKVTNCQQQSILKIACKERQDADEHKQESY